MKGDFTRDTFRRTKHYSSVRMQQGRVQIDADWNEQMDISAHLRRTAGSDVIGVCGAPLDNAGFGLSVVGGALVIGKGRYYVDGILCENDIEDGIAFVDQPHDPDLPEVDGPYLAYLLVWERHITALEDDHIREKALGGPDTATRTEIVWQVRLNEITDGAATCSSDLPEWKNLVAPPTGELSARAVPGAPTDDPCEFAPGGGYRRLQNQLYRVEIHQGDPDPPTFKWSRDNGTVVAEWLEDDGSLTPNQIRVGSLGRDEALGFAAGQWVELTDDTHELNGEPGTLALIVGPPQDRVLTLDRAVSRADFSLNPKVRRWDMAEDDGALGIETGRWFPLEDGVEVKFAAGSFRTGDYWLIPARIEGGDVEWPLDDSGDPDFQEPHGIHYHYCPLALVNIADGKITQDDISDCRKLFPPITEPTLFYVSGDGQEVMPQRDQELVPLDKQLVVGVANGQHPVAGATVRFTLVKEEGHTTGQLPGLNERGIVPTDSKGLASCTWELRNDPDTPVQQVKAELLHAAGDHVPLPIIFTANLSLAKQVAYDPSRCELTTATNVQDAIDELCEKAGRQPAEGIHITEVFTGATRLTRKPVENDTDLSVGRLTQGLHVVCDKPVVPDMIKRPTCFVTLELPYPFGPSGRELWGTGPFGFQTIVLAGEVAARRNQIGWKPAEASQRWLKERLFDMLTEFKYDQRLLARLILKGNFIGDAPRPKLYLDGEAFGAVRGEGDQSFIARVPLREGPPSGDGIPGGDFEMWFWLTPRAFMSDSERDRDMVAGIAMEDPRLEAVGGAWVPAAGFEEVAGESTRVDLVVGLHEGAELTTEARLEVTRRLSEAAGYPLNVHFATAENLDVWTSTETPEPVLTDERRLFRRGG